ncbi:MAG TPA: NAD(P)H-binding protein [Pseudolysinimonas sp.]|nr:NAD(P)H-binding protein [Pseudolysinimonas sp.]
MTRVTVLGGTGYAGRFIVEKAARAGYDVRSLSRSEPSDPVAGVSYVTGSLLDSAVRQQAIANSDIVIGALSPRGELTHELEAVYADVARRADAAGVRLGIVGGWGALRPTEGAPRYWLGELSPEYAEEATTMGRVLDWFIESAPESLDWFFVSPAAMFGDFAPGEDTGNYRIGTDIELLDASGQSAIGGADFATAIVAEITSPHHHRVQFSVAY